ncbi:hypothetical protein J6590_090380 [Homalodisca vitripennis]|nr:hypothetical protein J6590_090380 [Homalodisca vitripennis]
MTKEEWVARIKRKLALVEEEEIADDPRSRVFEVETFIWFLPFQKYPALIHKPKYLTSNGHNSSHGSYHYLVRRITVNQLHVSKRYGRNTDNYRQRETIVPRRTTPSISPTYLPVAMHSSGQFHGHHFRILWQNDQSQIPHQDNK